jgi:hypothetical protein
MKIRAHATGKIIGRDRTTSITDKQLKELETLLSKVKLTEKQAIKRDELQAKKDALPKLSKTPMTYIEELAVLDKYGIKKDFHSRYVAKGLEVEDEAIQIAGDVLGWDFVDKNEENFQNEFVTGTPDIIHGDLLADVKSSYDITTFPFFAKEVPNQDYFWQMQSYMWLTGTEQAELCYVLVNTPEMIVQDEIRRESWNRREIEISEECEEYVRSKHEFDHVPMEKRVKRFIIKRDEDAINHIKESVLLCREYYKQIIEEL